MLISARRVIIRGIALATILLLFVFIFRLNDNPLQSSDANCCPQSLQTATLVSVSPQALDDNVILPTGWITTSSALVQVRAQASVAAFALSNDGTNWSQSIPTMNGQSISTTWNFGEDGIRKMVYLRLEDTKRQVVTVIPRTVNVDMTPPISHVQELPPFSSRTFELSWSAIDATSGVGSYDLQMRVGETNNWTDWLTDSTVTSSTYDGMPGETYYFRVRAKDVAGNVETWRESDTSTTIPPTD